MQQTPEPTVFDVLFDAAAALLSVKVVRGWMRKFKQATLEGKRQTIPNAAWVGGAKPQCSKKHVDRI